MTKKASMNLDDALVSVDKKAQEETKSPIHSKPEKLKKPKKKQVPMYFDPALHEALQTICFSERKSKTSMQSLVIDGLDLLFKKKGLPSVQDIISGDKKIEL